MAADRRTAQRGTARRMPACEPGRAGGPSGAGRADCGRHVAKRTTERGRAWPGRRRGGSPPPLAGAAPNRRHVQPVGAPGHPWPAGPAGFPGCGARHRHGRADGLVVVVVKGRQEGLLRSLRPEAAQRQGNSSPDGRIGLVLKSGCQERQHGLITKLGERFCDADAASYLRVRLEEHRAGTGVARHHQRHGRQRRLTSSSPARAAAKAGPAILEDGRERL
jgi:hypothetical protein